MLSVGIYTPAEVARLIRLPRAKLQRWIKGYKYRLPTKPDSPYRRKEPLVSPTLPPLEGYTALTFLDLIELLFVKAFSEKRKGFSVFSTTSENPLFRIRNPLLYPLLSYGGARFLLAFFRNPVNMAIMKKRP